MKVDRLVVFGPVSVEIDGGRILGLTGCCPLQSRVHHEATGQSHDCQPSRLKGNGKDFLDPNIVSMPVSGQSTSTCDRDTVYTP
jgi:hypothetical protein